MKRVGFLRRLVAEVYLRVVELIGTKPAPPAARGSAPRPLGLIPPSAYVPPEAKGHPSVMVPLPGDELSPEGREVVAAAEAILRKAAS